MFRKFAPREERGECEFICYFPLGRCQGQDRRVGIRIRGCGGVFGTGEVCPWGNDYNIFSVLYDKLIRVARSLNLLSTIFYKKIACTIRNTSMSNEPLLLSVLLINHRQSVTLWKCIRQEKVHLRLPNTARWEFDPWGLHFLPIRRFL